jgi:hypothetical protein
VSLPRLPGRRRVGGARGRVLGAHAVEHDVQVKTDFAMPAGSGHAGPVTSTMVPAALLVGDADYPPLVR